jgi:plastocyanin
MSTQTTMITASLAIAIILLTLNFDIVNSLTAVSPVTITTDEDKDESSPQQDQQPIQQDQQPIQQDQQPIQQDQQPIQQDQQPIQPTTGLQQQDEGNGNNGDVNNGNYDVVIPDGAAWSETISERFHPSELTVPAGSDVTWINDDDLPHTVTSGNKATYGSNGYTPDGKFNSENLEHGDSFSFHFAEPGKYEYYCTSHPWMSGVVMVK